MIRWKVVTHNRKSVNHSFYSQSAKGYILDYEKGTIVKAIKGSLGIMTFQTKRDALSFLVGNEDLAKVIKVEGKGRGKRLLEVFSLSYYRILKDCYIEEKLGLGSCTWLAPKGTMSYSEVEVLT